MEKAEGYRLSLEGCRKGARAWTFAEVEERMIDAMELFLRLPDDRVSPFAKDGPWAEIRRHSAHGDYLEIDSAVVTEMMARERGGLSTREYDRMEEAMDWIRFVPAKGDMRRIIGQVLLQRVRGGSRVDWAEVKRRLGTRQSHDVLRMTYSRSIATIAKRLSH